MTDRYRFAYADPPYVGQARKHYGNHPDYAGEVDHAALLSTLRTYDGWALSASMKSLRSILPLCPPDALVLAWVKPSNPPHRDNRIYSWEPVILHGGKRPELPTPTSCTVQHPTGRGVKPDDFGHVIGEKPIGFCYWLFSAAGLRPTDLFFDLYPGSGAVGRYWESYVNQPRLKAYPRQNNPVRWSKESQPDQERLNLSSETP